MVSRILPLRSCLTSSRAAYTTFKSKNDEENNKALLNNLKAISLTGGRTKVPYNKVESQMVDRNVTLEILEKVSRYWTSDALIWNPYTLSRIFHIPEEYIIQVVWYVRPMMFYAHKGLNEVQKIHKTSIVIDVNRLKNDKKYLVQYQKLVFKEKNEPLQLDKQRESLM